MTTVGEVIAVALGVVCVVVMLCLLGMVLAWPMVDGWCELRDWWRAR
jgi:hypothetical protein